MFGIQEKEGRWYHRGEENPPERNHHAIYRRDPAHRTNLLPTIGPTDNIAYSFLKHCLSYFKHRLSSPCSPHCPLDAATRLGQRMFAGSGHQRVGNS